jgi:heme-degrading monooxygenase HmoA
MILELAILAVRPEAKAQFEAAFAEARKVISAADGFISHQLQRCLETDGRYVLLVQWQTVEHHMKGFRESPRFQQWRALLGPFFATAPAVEHYELISSGERQ